MSDTSIEAAGTSAIATPISPATDGSTEVVSATPTTSTPPTADSVSLATPSQASVELDQILLSRPLHDNPSYTPRTVDTVVGVGVSTLLDVAYLGIHEGETRRLSAGVSADLLGNTLEGGVSGRVSLSRRNGCDFFSVQGRLSGGIEIGNVRLAELSAGGALQATAEVQINRTDLGYEGMQVQVAAAGLLGGPVTSNQRAAFLTSRVSGRLQTLGYAQIEREADEGELNAGVEAGGFVEYSNVPDTGQITYFDGSFVHGRIAAELGLNPRNRVGIGSELLSADGEITVEAGIVTIYTGATRPTPHEYDPEDLDGATSRTVQLRFTTTTGVGDSQVTTTTVILLLATEEALALIEDVPLTTTRGFLADLAENHPELAADATVSQRHVRDGRAGFNLENIPALRGGAVDVDASVGIEATFRTSDMVGTVQFENGRFEIDDVAMSPPTVPWEAYYNLAVDDHRRQDRLDAGRDLFGLSEDLTQRGSNSVLIEAVTGFSPRRIEAVRALDELVASGDLSADAERFLESQFGVELRP